MGRLDKRGFSYPHSGFETSFEGWDDRGDTEQEGYEQERWRRGQEWSPSQSTDYQTDARPQSSEYGYGGRGRGEYDAGRFGGRSPQSPHLGGEGDFQSNQGRRADFDTGRYGYGGTGSRDDRTGSAEFEREKTGQGRYERESKNEGGRYKSQQTGFRGKGPRGYTRSDQRIEEDVNERLSDDYYLDASNIEVAVQSGTVTLSGEVEDRGCKRYAEDIVECCPGVQQVQNNIRVGSSSSFENGSDVETSTQSAPEGKAASSGS